MDNKCNSIYNKLDKSMEILRKHPEDKKINISLDKSEIILLKVSIATYDKFTSTVVDEMCKNK